MQGRKGGQSSDTNGLLGERAARKTGIGGKATKFPHRRRLRHCPMGDQVRMRVVGFLTISIPVADEKR
jgi:hypothetical protein